MSDIGYYTERQAEDAMAVMAGWIGRNRNVQVIYHDGTAVDADIFKGVIRIPRMACASGITQEALMLLRSRVYHESGHIDETNLPKRDYPKAGVLFEIWNAIEDRRMEWAESRKHKGCEVVFRWSSKHHNRRIASKLNAGDMAKPLWEALVAMSFMVEGLQPAWRLSEKAQAYVDAAYDEFSKVRFTKSARETLALAKKVYEILKEAHKEYKKDHPEQQKQEKKDEQQDSRGDDESGSEEGASQSMHGGSDFDDEENEEDEQPSSSGGSDEDEEEDEGEEKSKSKSKAKSKSKSEDEEDEGEDSESKGDEEEDEDDEESDEDDEESDGSDDSEESEDEEESGGSDDLDSDEDSEDDEESDEDDEESDEDDEESDDNEDEDGIDTNGDDEESDASEDEDSEDESDSESGGDGGNGADDIDEGNDKQQSEEDIEREMERECDGLSKQDIENEELEDYFKNLDRRDSRYLSRRDNDIHRIPVTQDGDKSLFLERRKEVAVMVAAMTRSLEQALRALSRCKKMAYLRHGKIDKKRYVQIAKNLSKQVFFRTREGIKLDTAVEIVIDESGSMSNFLQVQLLAMAIGEALEAIHVPFEITGTTTSRGNPPLDGFTRSKPIVYSHYKSFHEKWQAVRHRLVHTSKHNNNIDGEAVEYCAFRLKQRKERRKIIFSLSDGEPYGGQGKEVELASNLIRVCERCRKEGIEVYGFGVGTKQPQSFYGKKYFVYLKNAATMGVDFVRKFATVITGGAVKV